jgi:branched-chain amino acid transport system substrate-binding protein
LLLLFLSACASTKQQPGVSAATATDIPIAVVGPLSGDLAEFGMQMREAAKLAVADINAAGGVLGKPLRLIVQDDGCDPDRATSVARQVVAQKVVAVIGHFCSGVSIPASAVYHDKGVLQITPASSNPRLTEEAGSKGWMTLFRTCPRDDRQGVFAADYLATHYAGDRVALLKDESNYARTVETPLRNTLTARGVDPVFRAQIEAGQSSYQDVIDQLAAARPDVVYYSGYHPEAAILAKEARASGIKAAFFGFDALMTNSFAQQAGTAADGTMFVGNPSATQTPQAADLLRRLPAVQGSNDGDAQNYAVFTYAAFQEYAMAAQSARSIDAKAVARALRSGSFDTVIGTVAFDEKGDLREQVFSWYRFRAGRYEPVP